MNAAHFVVVAAVAVMDPDACHEFVIVAGGRCLFFLVTSAGTPGGDVPTSLVFLVRVGDLLADDDLVLNDHPRVERFVPVQKPTLALLRNVQEDPPGHGDLVAGMNHGVMLIMGRLDKTAVKAVPRIICADLGFANNHVVGPRALHNDRLATTLATKSSW